MILPGVLHLNMIYSDPQTQFVYPFTMGTQSTDNFSGTATYTDTASGTTIVYNRTGTISIEGDAYGTLTTPSGTFNNVLRMKVLQTITDTVTFVGSPFPPIIQTINITTYNWMQDNPGHIQLFQLSYDTTQDNQGGPPAYGKNAFYQLATVGVNEVNLKSENVNTYPNPATTITMVDISSLDGGEAHLQVFDATGRLVKDQQIFIGTGEKKSFMLGIEEFQNGIYMITITQKDKLLQSKFIKN